MTELAPEGVDRALAESMLRALREPAALLTRAGEVLATNDAWEQLSRAPDAPPVLTATVGTSLPARCRTAELNGFRPGRKIAASIEEVLEGKLAELDLELEWTARGALRAYLVTVTPLRGGVCGALVLHREITAQRLAQESLSESWDFYLRVFDDFPGLVFRFGKDRVPSYFNRTFLEFSGRTSAELRGEGWLQLVHPADRAGFTTSLVQAMDAHLPGQLELRYRRRDGEFRWLVLSGKPYFDEDRSFDGYVFVAADITELRRAEALAIEARGAQVAAELRAAGTRSELADAELGELEAYHGGEQAHATLRSAELPPLFEQSPEVFTQLERRYGELMELALERQVYRDVTASASPGLKELGERLGALNAGPRDVVELHARVMRQKMKEAAARRQAYLSEGRLLVLELMGNLAAYYRARVPVPA